MELDNASENMWLGLKQKTANEKLKQDTRTQDCDGILSMFVLILKQPEALSQH